MKATALKVSLVLFAYFIAIFIAVYFGSLLNGLLSNVSGGSFIGDPDTLNWLVGYPLAVIFLLTLFIHLYGGKHAWLWILVGASPAILFEIVLDPLHIYIPLILAAVAWVLGTWGNKAFRGFLPFKTDD